MGHTVNQMKRQCHSTKQEAPGKMKDMGRAQWEAEFTGDTELDSTSSPMYFWGY